MIYHSTEEWQLEQNLRQMAIHVPFVKKMYDQMQEIIAVYRSNEKLALEAAKHLAATEESKKATDPKSSSQ